MHVHREIAVELGRVWGWMQLISPAYTLIVICDDDAPWGPCVPLGTAYAAFEPGVPTTPRPPSGIRVESTS